MRLINAEALEKAMYHEAFEKDSDMQKWDSGCWIRYKMFENAIAAAPTVDAIPISVIEDIKSEIAHNFESIVGKYTSDTPLRDKAYVKCARNEAREECLAIIDKHIRETVPEKEPQFKEQNKEGSSSDAILEERENTEKENTS